MKRIHKLLTPFYWFICVAVVAFILYALANLLFISVIPVSFFERISKAFGMLLAALCCFCSLLFPRHPRASSQTSLSKTYPIGRRGPLLFGTMFLIVALAECFNTSSIPGLGDVFYLCQYPLLFSILLSLPASPLSKTMSMRILLDSVLVMTAVVTFSWYFLLGPILLQGSLTPLARIVYTIYPCGDLVLFFCILNLMFRSNGITLHSTHSLVLLGIVFMIIGDSLYECALVQNSPSLRDPQNILNSLAYITFILSTYFMRFASYEMSQPGRVASKQEFSKKVQTDTPSIWRSLLPFVTVAAVIALATYVWLVGKDKPQASGTYLGSGLFIGGIVLRQIVSVRETLTYSKKLELMQQELYTKNHELIEANRKLEKQATQIEQAYEQQHHLNELKDQFLLNVNHELRTPLTEIQGYLELLREHQTLLTHELQATFIDRALSGCDDLLLLIGSVMDTIKVGFVAHSLKKDRINVHLAVREVLDHLDPRQQQEYHIQLSIPETLSRSTDTCPTCARFFETYFPMPLSTLRLILCIMILAETYTPRQADENYAVTSFLICIRVQDSGPGIPPEEQPLLFGKFVRLKRDMLSSVRGTGLGLYICKQLVEAMDGSIWVESTGIPGQGSCFCFTLPVASD